MMQKQITGKPSKSVIAAFILAVVTLFYELFITLAAVFLILNGGLHCDRQDYGACALQNMFADLFGLILAMLFGLLIPAGLLILNGVLIIVGWKQENGGKNLLIATLAVDVLAVLLMFLFAAAAMSLLNN